MSSTLSLEAPVEAPFADDPARGIVRQLEMSEATQAGEVWIGCIGEKRFRLEEESARAVLEGRSPRFDLDRIECWTRTEATHLPSLTLVRLEKDGATEAIDSSESGVFDQLIEAEPDLSPEERERLKRFFNAGAEARGDALSPWTNQLQIDLSKAQNTSTALLQKLKSRRQVMPSDG